MKTDIEIAQEATLLPIKEVAANIGIKEDDLELYGKYKAKFDSHFMDEVKNNEDGKLVLVTAINPTPAGEGKTTTSVGVSQALNKLGKKTICALREPSLGPCFGIKGGAAGGWICTGCTNGRFKPSFYRGFSCNHICKQLISSNA